MYIGECCIVISVPIPISNCIELLCRIFKFLQFFNQSINIFFDNRVNTNQFRIYIVDIGGVRLLMKMQGTSANKWLTVCCDSFGQHRAESFQKLSFSSYPFQNRGYQLVLFHFVNPFLQLVFRIIIHDVLYHPSLRNSIANLKNSQFYFSFLPTSTTHRTL